MSPPFGLPVAGTLGGRPFRVAEFRLADVFDLEAWARSRSPDPFESAAFELLHGPRTVGWKRTLLSVLEATEAGEAAPLGPLNTPEGELEQVYLSIRRADPAATRSRVADAIGAGAACPVTTRLEVERILRVAWGRRPADLIRSLIDGPGPDAGTPDWSALWHRYVTTVTGPAPRFEDLTISQFRAWARGGRDADEDRPDAAEVAARRAEFWAELDQD